MPVEAPDASREFPSQLIVIAASVLLLFYCARSVVLPILLASVWSMALQPPVSWLRERRVPAPLAAAVILALMAAAVACGLVHFGRPVADWVKSAPESLSHLRTKYQRVFDPFSRMTAAIYDLGSTPTDHTHAPPAAPPAGGATQIAGTLFTWTGSVLAGVVETAVLLFLLLASGDRLIDKLSLLMPTLDGRS